VFANLNQNGIKTLVLQEVLFKKYLQSLKLYLEVLVLVQALLSCRQVWAMYVAYIRNMCAQ